MKIPFCKPNLKISESELTEVRKIIESGWFCLGEYTNRLEEYFKLEYDVKYAVACSSATQGLTAALLATGMKNRGIALPSFTWPSTLYAIECSGNHPVFCDIRKDTWSIDLNPRNKYIEAVVPVDIFGSACYIETNLPVIYDAAHGFGLQNLGDRGLIEVVSFSFTKPVTAGQGGIILTNDPNIHEDAREIVKLSAKITEVNALLFFNSLSTYHSRLEDRIRMIRKYKGLIKVPFITQHIQRQSNWSTFSILFDSTEKRDAVADLFWSYEIEVKKYYEPLVSGFPVTDDIYSRIIALPIYKEIEECIPLICALINEA